MVRCAQARHPANETGLLVRLPWQRLALQYAVPSLSFAISLSLSLCPRAHTRMRIYFLMLCNENMMCNLCVWDTIVACLFRIQEHAKACGSEFVWRPPGSRKWPTRTMCASTMRFFFSFRRCESKKKRLKKRRQNKLQDASQSGREQALWERSGK